MKKYMETLAGLLFAGADQAPQDFTTPLFMDIVYKRDVFLI